MYHAMFIQTFGSTFMSLVLLAFYFVLRYNQHTPVEIIVSKLQPKLVRVPRSTLLVMPDEPVFLPLKHMPDETSPSDHEWAQITLLGCFSGCIFEYRNPAAN